MKTKTIYHLDQDCNVVRIEVITKQPKKKKRPMIMNIERMKKNTTDTLQLHNRVISQNQKDYADFFEAEHQLVEYLKAHVGRSHFGTSLTYLLPMKQAFLSINDSNKELHSSQYLSYKLNKEHYNAAVSSAEGDPFSEM